MAVFGNYDTTKRVVVIVQFFRESLRKFLPLRFPSQCYFEILYAAHGCLLADFGSAHFLRAKLCLLRVR